MPLRQKVAGTGVVSGLALLCAGCGGNQNPIQVSTSGGSFVNGLWDGFTAIIVTVLNITGHAYSVHAAHAGQNYNVGWAIGLIIFIYLLYYFV